MRKIGKYENTITFNRFKDEIKYFLINLNNLNGAYKASMKVFC